MLTMASPSLLSTFLFLSLLLCTYITASATNIPPPAEAPHPPHHHHHHHPPPPSPPPSHPPPPPPTYSHPPPPTHPPPPPRSYPHPPSPSHPAPTPPAKPPVHPPAKPPAHPPVKPPAHPPAKPPAHPPVKPPAHPPVKPPSHPPVKPPSPPPKYPSPPPKYPPLRKKVAVQGVVYCKSCKFRGVDTLVGAAPLAGAVVKLVCNNTKNSLKELKTTDKNGFFFFMPQSLTTAGSHKCKVSLVSSPRAACNVPTNLHGGAAGALLIRSRKPPVDKRPKILPFELFTVGPFAFEAPKKLPCHY